MSVVGRSVSGETADPAPSRDQKINRKCASTALGNSAHALCYKDSKNNASFMSMH